MFSLTDISWAILGRDGPIVICHQLSWYARVHLHNSVLCIHFVAVIESLIVEKVGILRHLHRGGLR